tara:strand:+ start:3104 stop:4315 length:1212 start_codon:yes stop_codon:yes gene_type:complete
LISFELFTFDEKKIYNMIKKFFLKHKTVMKFIYYSLFIIIITTSSSKGVDTKATHAIILDFDTNDILYEKNSHIHTPPASMTKIMTSYIVFDRIKNSNLKLNDEFIVSEKAYKKGGSRMFLEMNSKVSVEDLLYGVIVQSGNDASIVIAENISGSESAFADLMNEYSKKLGMKRTNFVNSSGWPHPNHYSTMYDLAILSKAIISDFPELYKIFSEKKFKYNKIMQLNRNVLLKYFKGADGLKTGYVKDSGYGIVVSSLRDNRRIILAVNGLESKKSRVEEATRLLNWAYINTKKVKLLSKDQILTEADVWLGKDKKVNLISEISLFATLTSEQESNIKTKLIYNKPINAPIQKGQKVGKIVIEISKRPPIEIALLAKDEVKMVNPIIRIFSGINYLIFGNIND